MRINKAVAYSATTHEGGRADAHQSIEQELERAISTCLLWEDTHYEDGTSIAQRIERLCTQAKPEFISTLAIRARNDLKLRHIPLWLCVQLLKKNAGSLAGQTIQSVVKRPDEMGELLTLYWKDGRKPLAAQLKRGLAKVFTGFSPYNLAKWNKPDGIKLKDVMFMVHPKPKDPEQATTWKQLIEGTLESPDTWEVSLSAGKDKKATWERLLKENKLGDMALLMNLRNMNNVGVDKELINDRLRNWNEKSVALPFRFISAAIAAPGFEEGLGIAMTKALTQARTLPGRTLLLVDVSGSMDTALSTKSLMNRIDAASGLAMLLRELAQHVTIYATGGNDWSRTHATTLVPARHTFALRDAIHKAEETLGGGGIFCFQALTYIATVEKERFDRVIVLTDEADCDRNPAKTLAKAPLLGNYNYLFNVASYKPGLETDKKWIRINGWSERVIDWIQYHEAQQGN